MKHEIVKLILFVSTVHVQMYLICRDNYNLKVNVVVVQYATNLFMVVVFVVVADNTSTSY